MTCYSVTKELRIFQKQVFLEGHGTDNFDAAGSMSSCGRHGNVFGRQGGFEWNCLVFNSQAERILRLPDGTCWRLPLAYFDPIEFWPASTFQTSAEVRKG